MVFMAIKDPNREYIVLVGRKKSEEQRRQRGAKGAQKKVRSCLQLALVRLTNLKKAPYCKFELVDDFSIDHEQFSKKNTKKHKKTIFFQKKKSKKPL